MAHAPTPQNFQPPVPPPPADAENPAIIDAEKTYKITLISAALFVAAALLIIMRTRMS